MLASELNIFQYKLIDKKNITANINRVKANDSILCGYFCTGFINFMQKGKSFLDYANLLSPNEYEKNDKTILEHFLLLKTRYLF